MFTYEAVLAAALLTAPPAAASAHEEEMQAWFDCLRRPLLALSLGGELLDERELQGIFANPHDFALDVKLLQGRFFELRDAPFLEECRRFPARALATDFLAFNRAFRADVQARLAFDQGHADELRLALAEIDHLHHVWDTLRDASCPLYYVTVRRRSLRLVRELIGAEAFYRGQLPPHVPTWCLPIER